MIVDVHNFKLSHKAKIYDQYKFLQNYNVLHLTKKMPEQMKLQIDL